MHDENLSVLVREHFPQLSHPDLLKEIAQVGVLKTYDAGEIIMDYGSYIRMVPLLIEGYIKVMREGDDGNELFLYYLNAGDACSMSFSCCMMEKQSVIRTTAEERSVIIGIPVKYAEEWLSRYAHWRNFVMLSYDNRMFELVKTIDNIAFRKMDERLLDYLQKKAAIAGGKEVNATHQEIANDLNASREAVSRLLKQLETLGQVSLGRNKILLT
ncbi:MAG: Crp/Fnr family transcriptional regulator [Bacteroidia bacterium]|nr:Crp/Fnr family transcriptional regulator [Bacteroidia bacterium]